MGLRMVFAGGRQTLLAAVLRASGIRADAQKKPGQLVPWPAVFLERVTGIEPALEAWKASVLPLNHTRDWSGRQDSNLRHPAPKAGALPDCATSRRPNSLVSIPELLARAR